MTHTARGREERDVIWFLEGRRALGDKGWGFLDGANQGTLGICGTGAVFFYK